MLGVRDPFLYRHQRITLISLHSVQDIIWSKKNTTGKFHNLLNHITQLNTNNVFENSFIVLKVLTRAAVPKIVPLEQWQGPSPFIQKLKKSCTLHKGLKY